MYCRSMASNLHLRIRELLGEFVNVFDGSVVWERGGAEHMEQSHTYISRGSCPGFNPDHW